MINLNLAEAITDHQIHHQLTPTGNKTTSQHINLKDMNDDNILGDRRKQPVLVTAVTLKKLKVWKIRFDDGNKPPASS